MSTPGRWSFAHCFVGTVRAPCGAWAPCGCIYPETWRGRRGARATSASSCSSRRTHIQGDKLLARYHTARDPHDPSLPTSASIGP